MLQRLLSPIVEVRKEESFTAFMMFTYSCLAMTAWTFRPMVREHPSIAFKLLERMAHQLAG